MRQGGTGWQRRPWGLWLVIALGFALATPTSAMAAARCEDFMLSCVIDGIPESVNVRKLMSNSKLRKYVQRHARACSLMANSNEPYGCDWKATVRLGAAPATERTNSHHEPAGGANNHDDSAPGSNDAQAPTPRRDAAGRHGTTPAPSRQAAAVAPDRGPYGEAIAAAAQRYQLPSDLVRAVIQVESAFNPKAESGKGAVGLMQLLPETGKAMGAVNLLDPTENIGAGARFLRLLANRFNGDLVKVLSAYHAGSTRVLRREATPFAATDSYVRKVLGVYYALQDG